MKFVTRFRLPDVANLGLPLLGGRRRAKGTSIFDVPQTQWAESHGANDGHQGAGAIYFGLPYMLKARKCVCLGSGAGFVPLLMLCAQRKLIEEGVLRQTDVSLVDADTGIWGRPVYRTGRDIDAELRFVKELTVAAASQFSDIDYLHLDADHSYDGVRADLEAHFPRLSGNWAITVHDTDNPGAVAAGLPIGARDAASDFAREHGLGFVNFRVGCGTALLMPTR